MLDTPLNGDMQLYQFPTMFAENFSQALQKAGTHPLIETGKVTWS